MTGAPPRGAVRGCWGRRPAGPRRPALCAAVVLVLAACQPAPPTATVTPASAATAAATGAATAEIAAPPTAASSATPAVNAAPPTAAPQALTVCLGSEPRSLYRYAPPEAGRAHVHAALYGGPLDGAGFAAGLLSSLPSLESGDVVVASVEVPAGAPVVDHLGRVVALAEGVAWLAPDGSVNTFGEPAAAVLPQVTVTFRLRPGLRWSDGAPLTAHDSAFAFEVGRSPAAFDPRAEAAARTAAYTALDDLTLQWVGLPGYLHGQMAGLLWPPLPRHRYAGLTPAQIGDGSEANRAPLGWGPFRLAAWAPGDSLTLAPNPYYARAAPGVPRLAGLTFRFLSDPAHVVDELAAGRCDVAPSQAGFDDALRAPAAGRAPLPPGVRVYTAPGDVLETLVFGLAPAPGHAASPAAGLLADGRVRQAVAHCLDRAALAGGVGQPAAAWQPNAAGLSPLPFDPARGRSLLAEAGWTDALGALTLAGGPAGAPAREALLQAVAAQLAGHCGLPITPLPLTRGELEADWPDGVIFGRRFDLALLAWRAGPGHCALYLSHQQPGPDNPGGANAGGYASAVFDQACRRSLAALDPAQAAVHDAEAQRLFAADLPAVPLFFRPRLSAARADVAGYALGATFDDELGNLELWGIGEGE